MTDLIQSPQTTYRVIGYGPSTHGFFNEPRFIRVYRNALSQFREFQHTPEMSGVVLIAVRHETWELIEQSGDRNVEVVYGPLGTFRVRRGASLGPVSYGRLTAPSVAG